MSPIILEGRDRVMDDLEGPSLWYLDTFQKNLRMKDEASKRNIFLQVRSMVRRIAKDDTSKEDLVKKMGDPARLGMELSASKNWYIDLGNPLFPGVGIEPFFSRRGRFLLIVMFLLAISIPVFIFFTKPDDGWLLPGLLMIFVVIWALGLSFLNSYLGYLATLSRLRGNGLNVRSMGYGDLRRHSLIFGIISVGVSFALGTTFFIVDNSLLSISFPLFISTAAASIIACRMMIIEGGKVLNGPKRQ
ncbi:MAG: hypothetical protein JW939_01690 [Candidatus Thermoplasmatota archaeon]|nr:hypothetical protein [Candidatus Thermoplasmatota archaeon]